MRLPPPSDYLRRVARATTLEEMGLGRYGGAVEIFLALAALLALGILPSCVELVLR